MDITIYLMYAKPNLLFFIRIILFSVVPKSNMAVIRKSKVDYENLGNQQQAQNCVCIVIGNLITNNNGTKFHNYFKKKMNFCNFQPVVQDFHKISHISFQKIEIFYLSYPVYIAVSEMPVLSTVKVTTLYKQKLFISVT